MDGCIAERSRDRREPGEAARDTVSKGHDEGTVWTRDKEGDVSSPREV